MVGIEVGNIKIYNKQTQILFTKMEKEFNTTIGKFTKEILKGKKDKATILYLLKRSFNKLLQTLTPFFQEIFTGTKKYYGFVGKLTDKQKAQIVNFQNLIMSEFRSTASNVTAKVGKEINRALIFNKEINLEQVLKIYKRGTNERLTYNMTNANGFSNYVNTRIGEASGIKKFRYSGKSIDGLTRPFCARHYGQVKTKAEWDGLDNGQLNPVSVYMGGYNCRHSLVGVIEGF